MQYRFYTVSSAAWDAMLTAIKEAKQSIYWESYTLEDNTPSHNFFQVLNQKAQQGVRVKIIADALGSFWLSTKVTNELKEAGAEVLFFNHLISWWNWQRFRHWWFNRNHKKILIIDEKIGFIGGVNVAKRYSHWLDLHVRLQGLIVRSLIRSFIRSYKICGGRENLHYKYFGRSKNLRLLDHFPFLRGRNFKRYYLQYINRAQHEIVIATPYFLPHPWLIKALLKASARGARVEVILPKKVDVKLYDWANYTFAAAFKDPRINFYFTNLMVHAKCLLVDNKEGLVGSVNIHSLSFDYNAESALSFRHAQMLRDLKLIIESWKQQAEKFNPPINPRLSVKILEFIFKLIQPIL